MSKPDFLYRASTKRWGYYHLITGLVFGVCLGVLFYINPFDNHAPSWLMHGMGVLFMLGGAWQSYKGIKLIQNDDFWHVEINQGKLIYRMPRASRENSFEIALHEIEAVVIEVQPADSEADDVTYLLSKQGDKHHIGYMEALFNTDKLIRTLKRNGVCIKRKPR